MLSFSKELLEACFEILLFEFEISGLGFPLQEVLSGEMSYFWSKVLHWILSAPESKYPAKIVQPLYIQDVLAIFVKVDQDYRTPIHKYTTYDYWVKIVALLKAASSGRQLEHVVSFPNKIFDVFLLCLYLVLDWSDQVVAQHKHTLIQGSSCNIYTYAEVVLWSQRALIK